MKALVCGAVSALFLTTAAHAATVNLVKNGSFETGPNVESIGFTTVNAGSDDIDSWTVGGNSVDYIGSYWMAQDGARSIDMSGNGPGSLSQSFSTIAGQRYTVGFYVAGNTDGGSFVKTMSVDVNGVQSTPIGFDTSGFSRSNMGWSFRSFNFTGSGTDTLTFTSLDNNAYGMALDNVTVMSAVPLPASAPLFGAALLALGGYGYSVRRRKASAAA